MSCRHVITNVSTKGSILGVNTTRALILTLGANDHLHFVLEPEARVDLARLAR
jgi:hypothetical protein